MIKKIKIDDYEIALYNWKATGPSILLIHGWESHSYRWKNYIQHFSELNYNIFAIDAPAHGLSSGKEFTPLYYAKAIDKVVQESNIRYILSHSVGAYSTIYYLSHFNTPDDLESVILKAPTGSLKSFTNQFFNFLKLNQSIRDSYEDIFEDTYGKPMDYYDSFELIKKINISGLLIHDNDDAVLPVEESHLIHQNCPQGKFITTDGHGHRLLKSQVMNLISDFLAHQD